MKITAMPIGEIALHRKQLKVRIPKDFPWKLLRKIQDDLGLTSVESVTGDFSYSDQAKTSAFKIEEAVAKRDLILLNNAIAEVSPQRTVNWVEGAYEFYALYQLGALLKKYPFSSGDTTAKAALDKFLFYERECELFNTANFRTPLSLNSRHPDFLGIIEEIRADILRLIGSDPKIERVYDCAKHGPGAAVGEYDGGRVTTYFKWSIFPYTCSPSALPYAVEAIERDPRWIGAILNHYREVKAIPQYVPISMVDVWDYVFSIRDYCKYSSVPKTALTDRAIAIEPSLNVYLQLGVDRIIRSRLKRRWRIDLNTQKLNQDLAYKSSREGGLVTLDLEGASETVALMCCRILLPEAWFNLLLDLRSKNIMLPDETVVPLHKISAMGNGFTFALESLIFSAFARCAMRRTKTKGDLAVYGDDIILPQTAYNYLLELLSMFGFKVNVDKTFASGPFRESCGADYFRGYNVRPFFCKVQPKTVQEIFYIHNSLWNLEHDFNWAWGLDFKRTRRWLRKFLPDTFRYCVGPPSESLDTYLFSTKPQIFRNQHNQRVHQSVKVTAKRFNGKTDFFFRKLMVNLRGEAPPFNKWDKKLDTGNAFDVTKRDRVRFSLTPRIVW